MCKHCFYLRSPPWPRIILNKTATIFSFDYPTANICKPDIVLRLKIEFAKLRSIRLRDPFGWDDSPFHEGSFYLSYARPEHVSVHGIYTNVKGVTRMHNSLTCRFHKYILCGHPQGGSKLSRALVNLSFGELLFISYLEISTSHFGIAAASTLKTQVYYTLPTLSIYIV